MAERELQVEMLVNAVLLMYRERFEPVTVAELAAYVPLGWSAAKVRTVAEAVFHKDRGWTRIRPVEKAIEVREKSYKTVVCERMVRAYQPTTEWLAKLLNEAEGK